MNGMKRTQIAQQGIDFVTLFHAKFTSTDVSSYRPLLREPTESTGGGKQAMQHMVLMPASKAIRCSLSARSTLRSELPSCALTTVCRNSTKCASAVSP